MGEIDARALVSAFSKRLAARDVSDESVQALANQVAQAGARPIDIDICQFGICLDYWVPRKSLGELRSELVRLASIRRLPDSTLTVSAAREAGSPRSASRMSTAASRRRLSSGSSASS